jgi:hypothetical protein
LHETVTDNFREAEHRRPERLDVVLLRKTDKEE